MSTLRLSGGKSLFSSAVTLPCFSVELSRLFHIFHLTPSDFHFLNQNVLAGAVLFFCNQYSNIVRTGVDLGGIPLSRAPQIFPTEYHIRWNSNPAGLPVFAAIWGPDFRASTTILTHTIVYRGMQRRGTRGVTRVTQIVALFILHVASLGCCLALCEA